MEMSRGLLIATLDARLVCTRVWKILLIEKTLNQRVREEERYWEQTDMME